MNPGLRHAIQLNAGHLHQRHTDIRGNGDRLAYTIIGVNKLLDIQR